MPTPPDQPKIYHIVHVDRLSSIVADGCLRSDAEMIQRTGNGTTIGMSEIKQRRLSLRVHCHPGTHVGHYVPFYFCPRSIMLYVIHRANHPELAYLGGQGPIVHLEANLNEVVNWADGRNRPWAFSLSNAGAFYTEFRCDLGQLDEVNWPAVAATNFAAREIKEGKQAEFLMYESFPWKLIRRIGAHSRIVQQQVHDALRLAGHKPPVEIRPAWYY